MMMTDAEIIREYREAKTPLKQIGILADENQCSRGKIVDILRAAGMDLPGQFQKGNTSAAGTGVPSSVGAVGSDENSTQGKAEAEKLRAEAEALRKQLAMSSQEITVFKLRFAAWQDAHKLMTEAFAALPDEETKEKMRAAIRAQVKAWGYAS